MLLGILQLAAQYWLAIVALGAITHILTNKFKNGLNSYPGPALAAYTDWWRFWDVYKKSAHETHQKLHDQHGEVVRLGPNMLSFSNPQAIRDIYGLNKGFSKTAFYPVQQAISKGRRIASLFSTTDDQFHAQLKRVVSGSFAMSTLVSLEPLVDSTTQYFLDRTQAEFCDTGKPCDFARWLQFYAFDVIGEMTWSKRLGFIEKNKDVDGIVDSLAWFFRYSSYIGQQPWLDRIFNKNPIKLQLSKYGIIDTSSPAAIFAVKQGEERRAELDKIKTGAINPDEADLAGSEKDEATSGAKGVDFLTRFTLAQRSHPEFFSDFLKFTATMSLVNAGSDTTAISLAAVFYHLLRHPRVYAKLMAELDSSPPSSTEGQGKGKEGKEEDRGEVFGWAHAQQLPYLDAVIQETFRMFPAAGLLLERHVPPQGATICGRDIPGGTIVGCSAWVLHRRRDIFGDDVYTFRPERWLDADAESLKQMRATMFQFGGGSRTCIGRHISLLEMYKLIPSFLTRFEIEFVDPEKDWTIQNCWFVRQLDFMVKFKPRKSSSSSSSSSSAAATAAPLSSSSPRSASAR